MGIPLGMLVLFQCMHKLVQARIMAKNKITSIREILAMDKDGDGEVTCAEYSLHMLKSLGKIHESDILMLEKQFRTLDKSGDGLLSAADITAESEMEAMQLSKVMI